MAYKEYIFSLQKKSYEFWQTDGVNVVANHQPYFLQFAPDGWEGFSVKNIRNKNYWGVDRTVSLPFSYVEDGAGILKYIMYSLGIEESVYLSICKLQMNYNALPKGVTSISNLIVGNNYGTITADANTTVYLKVVVTGLPNQDNISGQIGDIFVGQFASTQIYTINIPTSGIANINVFLDNSGGGSATFTITDQLGDPVASYGYWYKQIYRGEVDLSEFKHDGSKVTCTTLEDGLTKYLKANENTVFELPLSASDAVTVKMDGINLHQTANYAFTDSLNENGGIYAVAFTFANLEGDQSGVINITENYEVVPNVTNGEANSEIYYVKNSQNYFFKNVGKTPIIIQIVGKIDVHAIQNGTAPLSGTKIKIKSSNPNGSGGTIEYPLLLVSPVAGTIYTYPINLTVTVQPQERLFMMGSTTSINNNLYDFEFLDTSLLAFKYITRKPTTYIKALTGQYIFHELINKVTDGNYSAAFCQYFSNNSQILWTCGNGIRGFQDAVLKISLSDFFQFYNCFDAVGLNEIGSTVLFDGKEKLIDKTTFIDLGEVSGLKISVAKDHLFNQYNTGYPPINSDVGTLNGNEEFNCGFQFSVGTTKSPSILERTSKTSASCYEIEKIRTTTINKATTEYANDNKNFILFSEQGQQNDLNPPYFRLDRSLNATATGLLEPLSVFNLALSPKRMVLRNGNFIRSSMYLADNLILKYTSSEKNNKVVCNGIIEKANEPILTIGNRFFYPILMDFTVPAPLDLIGLLDLNPLSIFRFTFLGVTYTGILQSVSTATDTNMSQNYTLLSTSDNDLKTLISFYG